MIEQKKTRYRKWPFLIGTLLLLAATALYVFNRLEDLGAKQQAEVVLSELHKQIPVPETFYASETAPYADASLLEKLPTSDFNSSIPDYILNPDMKMPVMEIEGNLYIGSLFFPALNLELPVLSSWSYPNLKIAPCVYEGSIYRRNAVIAAHNYKSHFGRLLELKPGDHVLFEDVDGNVFIYQVAASEVIDPKGTNEMISSSFDLSLFTCTRGGSARFTVRCKQLSDDDIVTIKYLKEIGR